MYVIYRVVMASKVETSHSEIKLETPGTTINAGTDATVGTVLRNIAYLYGCSKEEALTIHREHVRFYNDDDCVKMHVIGENPTAVNGESLSTGDTVAVSDGDILELSSVVEARIVVE